MSSASHRLCAKDERRWRAAADAIAVVRPLEVVEAHEALQGALKCTPAGEVGTAERHAPVLVQDGLLKPLNKAVGPGVPGLGAGVVQAAREANLIEGAL
jgi:hypothetical protein